MSNHSPSDPTARDAFRALWHYRKRWILGMLVIWGLVGAYLAVHRRPWEASQGIVIQDNVFKSSQPAGDTAREVERKSRQDTLLEISLSRSVLRNTLLRVGPPADGPSLMDRLAAWVAPPANPRNPQAWPAEEAVEGLRDAMALAPPKGAEFGKTDVFYLKVQDRDRQRALAIVAAMYEEVEKAFGGLRADMLTNTLEERKEAARLAEKNLAEATQRMAVIEKEAGVDLIALRMLHQYPNNDIALYKTLSSSVDDLRQVQAAETQNAALLKLLEAAKSNPQSLQAGPRDLINSHPALERLVQGLSEARLKGASLASRLTERDPELAAARREETEVHREIQRELEAAIQGVRAGQELAGARRRMLETQLVELQKRVDRLASFRAEYGSVVDQVAQRRTLMDEAQKSLTEALAAQAAADHINLLSRVDLPDGGLHPVGPRRAMLVLFGLAAGLIGGAGLVFLTAPITPPDNAPVRKRLRRHPRAEPSLRTAAKASLANGRDGNGQDVQHRVEA